MNISKIESLPNLPAKKRVCAYARVSAEKETALHSLSYQISYYSELIQKHKGWSYVGVYSDEGISGTRDTRPEFRRMVEDAKAGKIDMIITKSISRFARNTVILLSTIRELKEYNVDVFFEEQNIYSLSGDGELMLTLLASFAQEEAKSVSENMRWRIMKVFEEGRNYSLQVLGYDLKDGVLYINKEEEPIIKEIFESYLAGKGYQAIASALNKKGYKTKVGKPFQQTSISRILRNVIYMGDLNLERRYREELTKRMLDNNGQFDRFYVENAHEPIISKEMFHMVQTEIKRRGDETPEKHPNGTPFTGLIICGLDGCNFIRCNTGTRPCWKCGRYKKGGPALCNSRQIGESELYESINNVMGQASFFEKIKQIVVYPDFRLKFIFKDGEIIDTTYRERSRKESWTSEMKKEAGLRTHALRLKNKKEANHG